MSSFQTSIRKSAFFILIATAAFSIFSISALWIYNEITRSYDKLDNLKSAYEEKQKEFLKKEVNDVISLIEFTSDYNQDKSTGELQNDILNYVSSIRLKYGGYVFINTYDGKALIFDGVKIIGEKDITNMTDPDGLRLFDIELESIKKPDGGFFEYRFKKLDSFSPVPKISYVKGYDKWSWIIGAGIYLEDMSVVIQKEKEHYNAKLFKKILYIVVLLIFLLLVLSAVAIYLSRFISKEFAVFTSFLHKNPGEDSLIEQEKLQIEEFKGLAHSANIMIKQRRFAEKMLKKERDKAHKYLDVAGVIILALDVKGKVTLINKKGCETLGYKEYEIMGRNWFNHFIPLSEKQKISARFFKTMNGAIGYDFHNSESKIICRNGQERIISWNNTILYDENNKIVGSLSSGLDVTESKMVEASYFESEEKYKLLFEKTNDPVLIIGRNDTFIDCNESAVSILGLNKKEYLIGLHPGKLSPPRQPDGSLSTIRANEMINIARKNGFNRFEWLHHDNNKKPLYVDVSLTAIPVSGVEYLYVVWRNITDKKKQEQELVVAKEQAEQNNNIKTSFLHNMQHEIRTPLNAMMGFTQLLKLKGLSNDEQDDYFDAIISSGNQLSKIIDKIIDFSRLQSGFILITNETIELKTFLVDTYREYYNEIQNKKIRFIVNSDSSNSTSLVKTDVRKIKEIIWHLLDNAFKFTEKGTVELTCEIKDDNIVFNVTDTGVGIEKKHFNTIFGRFNRITHTNTEKLYRGNGLGLSISKAVLEFMGGNIWVDSQIGKGSRFSFSIPYKPLDISKVISSETLNGYDVTIVSNKKDVQKHISKVLKNCGVKITHIKSGMEVIELCQNNYSTDLMIMDIDLKGMNGVTATKAIKAFNSELNIIAYVDDNKFEIAKEDALLAGCVNYILRSDSDKNIIQTLAVYLSKDIFTRRDS